MRVARQRLFFITAVMAVCLTIRPGAPARAGTAETVLEITDLLPRSCTHDSLEALVPRGVDLSLVLVPPDRGLVAELRWAFPDPNRRACGMTSGRARSLLGSSIEAGASPSELMDALLERTRRQVMLVDLQDALETLRATKELVPCLEVIPSLDTVQRLLEYEAVAYLFLADPRAEPAFRDLAAVTTEPQLDASYPPAVAEAFMTAFRSALKAPRVPVDTGGVADPVYIDTLPASRMPDILPGRHLIQFQGPRGAVRSRLVTVSAESDALRVSSAVDVGLLTAEDVRSSLARALVQNTFSRSQREALDRFVGSQGRTEAAFAVAVGTDEAPTVLIYRPGTGASTWTPPPPPERVRKYAGASLAIGLTTQALRGPGSTFVANGYALGYSLLAAWPAGKMVALADLAIYPHIAGRDTGGQECGTYDGSAPPTANEIAAEASCLPARPLA